MEINEINDSEFFEVGLLNESSDLIVIESDDHIELIMKALSSKTRREILQQIQMGPMDVSDIAAILDMTEANISAQIKKLEKAKLISCDYSSGKHGVRKISSIRFNSLLVKFA
ncbi:MAG: ArsR family transcriptional regulator [Candidatus Lokiarchaeota archaeon]|nr:ArsR family transcriptional regulator [Candidatus Lokiarchaeota archaeon]MBD3200723.1 ArsR family transcriptional regulator [Candidatus Lokiarchaeota archaeon]